MNVILKTKYISFEDYLATEELATEKSEYYVGETFAMVGGTLNHNQIIINLCILLGMAFKKRDIRVFAGDVKLHIPEADAATYPDVLIIQGKPVYWDNRRDVVCNASLIIEVLSDSTQDYDRAGKFDIYRQLPDLTDYILINQNKIRIEHFIKQSKHQWLLTEYTDLNELLELKKFGTQLNIADIYDKVEFLIKESKK